MAENRINILIAAKNLASSELDKIAANFNSLRSSEGFKSVVQGVGVGVGIKAFGMLQGAVGDVIGRVQESISAASDLNETMNKSQVIFGSAAGIIEKFAQDSATSLGMSRNEAIGAAATFGNLFKTMGLGQTETADLSTKMVGLAADLASFHNIRPEDALEKLRSGLVGESEPLRALGVLLDENSVKQLAYKTGIAAVGAELTQGQKVQARYALIMQQTASAQGDFARTASGLANSQRIQAALMENAMADMGKALLPIATTIMPLVAQATTVLSGAFMGITQLVTNNLKPALVILTGVLVALAPIWLAALAPVLAGAAPFLAVAAAVGVLAVAVDQNILGLKDIFNAVFGVIQQIVKSVIGTLLQAAETAAGVAAALPGPWQQTATELSAQIRLMRQSVDTWGNESQEQLEDGKREWQTASTSIGASTADMGAAVGDLATKTKESGKEVARTAAEVEKAWVDSSKGMADGIRSGRSEVQSALETLRTDSANAMTKNAEIARLGGILTGQEVARGLHSTDELQRADAQYIVAVITAELDRLSGGAYSAGLQAGKALAAGLADANIAGESGRARQRQFSSLDAVKAAGQKVIDLFGKPLPSGSNLLDDIKTKASGAADATKAAADRIQKAIGDAFGRADKSARAYFDSVHARNLRAIDDARALADATYEAAVGRIDAEVQAARDALEAKRTARREQELRDAVANATTSDARAEAEQQLSDFLDDQNIARLEKDAQSRKDALAAQKEAQDRQFDSAKENEDRIYEAKVAAWEKAEEALKASLDKQTITYQAAAQQILALLSGAKTDWAVAGAAAGDALATSVATGLTGVKGAVADLVYYVTDAAGKVTSVLTGLNAQIASGAFTAGGGNLEDVWKEAWMRQHPEGGNLIEWDSAGYHYAQDISGAITQTKLAAGGPVAPTGEYLVGEAGPERLTMRGGQGYVTPIGGEREGGSPVVLQLNLDGRAVAEVVDRHLFYTYRTATRGGLA